MRAKRNKQDKVSCRTERKRERNRLKYIESWGKGTWLAPASSRTRFPLGEEGRLNRRPDDAGTAVVRRIMRTRPTRSLAHAGCSPTTVGHSSRESKRQNGRSRHPQTPHLLRSPSVVGGYNGRVGVTQLLSLASNSGDFFFLL